jgi:hypothetical protein
MTSLPTQPTLDLMIPTWPTRWTLSLTVIVVCVATPSMLSPAWMSANYVDVDGRLAHGNTGGATTGHTAAGNTYGTTTGQPATGNTYGATTGTTAGTNTGVHTGHTAAGNKYGTATGHPTGGNAYGSTTGTTTGTTGYPATGNSTNAGPHNTNVGNKIDPRVDSDLGKDAILCYSSRSSYADLRTDGRAARDHGNTGYATTGAYGSSAANNGPHNSKMMNKIDPRVDSDRGKQ